jgi:hypothetical protein
MTTITVAQHLATLRDGRWHASQKLRQQMRLVNNRYGVKVCRQCYVGMIFRHPGGDQRPDEDTCCGWYHYKASAALACAAREARGRNKLDAKNAATPTQ